jgi:hypothetical protein
LPISDLDPEVLQINIIETEDGAYADERLPFKVDATKYKGQMVLAGPRCCQKRKGTHDRRRINESVAEREGK